MDWFIFQQDVEKSRSGLNPGLCFFQTHISDVYTIQYSHRNGSTLRLLYPMDYEKHNSLFISFITILKGTPFFSWMVLL